MIKVMLVDDQRLFSEGVHAILKRTDDIKVVGMAANGQEAVQNIDEWQPDVILMDIHMPKVDGIRATTHLKDNYPDVKIILLTTFAEEDLIILGLRAGADGFLLKTLDGKRLTRSIRDAYDDQLVISGKAAKILAHKVSTFTSNRKEILGEKLKYRDVNLSKRELDIAYLLMDELTNKQIAQKLYLSEGTVKNYLSEIYHKLNIRQRKGVIIYFKGLFSKNTTE
ncbi:response regulator [Virgibacillus ainsalahensis]